MRFKANEDYFMGIDPGKSGGIVVLDGNGKVLFSAKMPDTEHDVYYTITGELNKLWGNVRALIEKVGGYTGGKGAPGSAMFNFGASVQSARTSLIASGVTWEDATPQKWQKAFNLGKSEKGPKGKTKWKNKLKAKAQQLFPKEKVTLKTADAYLIAEFCRRYHKGML